MKFVLFSALVIKRGVVTGIEPWYVNMDQVVCVRVLDTGDADGPIARWEIAGEKPAHVFALRFTAGDDILVLEDPWGAHA